ncbi:hypothetical protein Pst134EB_012516 [Puccinia striiformis f. sp. tritici]|nr:hypothetical protein Pst134EB_012516 [Puccinia striiformis f. sp. tritici]
MKKKNKPNARNKEQEEELIQQNEEENSALKTKTSIQNTNNLDLTQKVARLLSQEPSSIPTNTIPPSINLNQPALTTFDPLDFNQGINSLIEEKVGIFGEKIKLYQNQIGQLRKEIETKDQLLDEIKKIRQTDAEELLEKYKQIAETRYAGLLKLQKIQEDALNESRDKVIELSAKLSRVYSGEEERDRIRLEEEKQSLIQSNQQLKAAHDAQRKRRKEAERMAQQAATLAQENVQDQLNEANDEVKTLKKMLATETENSKSMINQINQLRSNASSSSSTNHHSNHNSGNSNNSSNQLSNEKVIEDLKNRLSIIGDFTGLEILSSTPDLAKRKGTIYECIFADIVDRGFALHFKIQVHPDETCSYTPALDPERDLATIKITPDFLRQFVRFPTKACAHVYWKLFQAFNLQDT